MASFGDRGVVAKLTEVLDAPRTGLPMALMALGETRDPNACAPLRSWLADATNGEFTRAFAAVSLGCILERDGLAFPARLAIGTNYRAFVPTLSDTRDGVLDYR